LLGDGELATPDTVVDSQAADGRLVFVPLAPEVHALRSAVAQLPRPGTSFVASRW